MPVIVFEGRRYDCREGETVLEALERQGVVLPSSCRAGACQTCLVRARAGRPTPESQSGLKDTLVAQGYFLACMCRPREDLEIALAETSRRFESRVLEKEWLNAQVVRLRLSRPEGFDYRAGQFINLVRPEDELVRSYSLASLPSEDRLELHVKKVPGGRMSGWLCDEADKGQRLAFFGPGGDCFYLTGETERPILLVGTGTGLAPLYGILRQALAEKHAGPVHLFHASLRADGLYLVDELRALARNHANLHYHPCVLHGEPPEGGMVGDISEIPARELGSLQGWRVYLCGDPEIVQKLKKHCFFAGAAMREIHADPFVFAPQVE